MPEFKIRVLVRDIGDGQEWFDKGEDTAEIVGIMHTDKGTREDAASTVMKMLNEMVNDGTR